MFSDNTSPPPERKNSAEPEMGGSIFDSSGQSTSTASTSLNQEHSQRMVPDQALIKLEREVTRPTVETDKPILPPAGTNCENQSSPTNSVNDITCVSANFQRPLDMLSPYQLENLTSLVNGDLVLLERKYRAIPNLELWESLIGLCLLNCYDEMVRDLGGISYEDRLTTKDSSALSLASEGLTTASATTTNEVGQLGLSTAGAEMLHPPSFRTVGAFV